MISCCWCDSMHPLARIIRNINCLVSHVNKEENLNRVIDSILQIFLKLISRCVAKAKLRRSASDDDQTLVPLHFFDSLGIGDSSVSHGGIAKSWRVKVVECEIVAKKRQSVLRSAANQYVFFCVLYSVSRLLPENQKFYCFVLCPTILRKLS